MNKFERIKPLKDKNEFLDSYSKFTGDDKEYLENYFADEESLETLLDQYSNKGTSKDTKILRILKYMIENYPDEINNANHEDIAKMLFDHIEDLDYKDIIDFLFDHNINFNCELLIVNIMDTVINPYDKLKCIFDSLKSHPDIKLANGKPWGAVSSGMCVANIPKINFTNNKTKNMIKTLKLFESNGGNIADYDYWIIDIALNLGYIDFAKYILDNREYEIPRESLYRKLVDNNIKDENMKKYFLNKIKK